MVNYNTSEDPGAQGCPSKSLKVLHRLTKPRISVIRGNGGILNWMGKLQHILQPGRRILDTLNGLSERNGVLPRENDNDGVESLILPQISKENHQFSSGKLAPRTENPSIVVKMLHPGLPFP